MTQGKADDTNKVFFNLPVIFDLDDDEQPQTEDEELDQLLTEFLTFTLGNKVIEASPEYARERAKAAIQSLLERRENETRIEELSSWVNSYILTTGIITDPFIEAVKARLIELQAELSQREKLAGKKNAING